MSIANSVTKIAGQRIDWSLEDIEKVLMNNGIDPIHENINVFVSSKQFEKMQEHLISEGFEYMTHCVKEVFDNE